MNICKEGFFDGLSGISTRSLSRCPIQHRCKKALQHSLEQVKTEFFDHLQEEIPVAKRRLTCIPVDMAIGAARAHRFLEEFGSMPLDQMDVKEAMQHVGRLTDALENDASENAWLKQLFLTS